MHRLFIGLPISEALQGKILQWEKKYEELLVVSPPNPPVRWLQGKNLHITLIPPWYEDDPGIAKAYLETVQGSGKISLKFERIAFGPDPRRPRLLWLEGETPKAMNDLQEKLHRALGKIPENGFDKRAKRRPLKLHLTLARFRPEVFASFPIQKLDERVDWQDTAGRLVLFESHLSPQGADYEVVAEFAL